jgi:ABC-type transporter MlaC component
MKKITVSIGLALALALPAGALAQPNPDQGDKRAAKAECKTLRGNSGATREAFRTQFRSLTACVRKTAVEEAQEEQSAHKNAAKECKDLRENHSAEFVAQYGERKNAYGKCVSSRAKEKEAEADEQDQQDATEWKNAAKECDDLRDNHAAEFTATYGDRPNAFGKCVSSKAKENNEEPAQQS